MKIAHLPICIAGIILLASCGVENQAAPDPNTLPKQSVYSLNTAPPPEEAHLPQPVGGPELTEREPSPVSNHLLQRKYPSIVVLRGSLKSNQIALTFDDGPDRRFTPRVLDVLKKHNVKATFFLMGSRASALPDVTKRIQNEGHSIGNHTYWHPNLDKESLGRLRWEAAETDKVLQQIVGYRPKLFRAPYGSMNDSIVQELGKMNYSAIGWSVDSLDWQQLNAEQVKKNVLSNVHPGAIILMHSGGHWSQDLSGMVQALDEIIPRLKKDGMKFVTIPQMFNLPEKR